MVQSFRGPDVLNFAERGPMNDRNTEDLRMRSRWRRATAGFIVLAATAAAICIEAVPVAHAGSFTASVATNGTIGTLYVDAIYDGGGGGGAYDAGYTWHSDGSLWNFDPAQGYIETGPAPSPLSVPGSPTMVRLELYPKPSANYWQPYDPWLGNVGGAQLQREKSIDGADWLNFGQVPLPTIGQLDAFRIEGGIVSATPVPDGRVELDLFQIQCGYPETCAATKVSTTGARVGAFSTSKSKGTRWTGSVGWPGFYIVFVRDTATGRNVHGFVDIAAGQVPSLDLDAVCFGLDRCVYDQGSPAVPQGGFHPLDPTRILDTRVGNESPQDVVNGNQPLLAGEALPRRNGFRGEGRGLRL